MVSEIDMSDYLTSYTISLKVVGTTTEITCTVAAYHRLTFHEYVITFYMHARNACTHTNTCTRTHTYTHRYTHTYTHMYTHRHIHTHIHTHTHTDTQPIKTHIYTCVHTNMKICTRVMFM